MKRIFIFLFFSLVLGITAFGENVDILIKNATILTMNSKKEIIENGVVAIRGNRIVAVGDEKIISKYKGKKVTNYEMESSAIAGLAAIMGHEAMTVCVIIANRMLKQYSKDYHPAIKKLIQIILDRI